MGAFSLLFLLQQSGIGPLGCLSFLGPPRFLLQRSVVRLVLRGLAKHRFALSLPCQSPLDVAARDVQGELLAPLGRIALPIVKYPARPRSRTVRCTARRLGQGRARSGAPPKAANYMMGSRRTYETRPRLCKISKTSLNSFDVTGWTRILSQLER